MVKIKSVFLFIAISIVASSFNLIADENKTLLTLLHTNDWQSRLLGFGPNADFTPNTINDDKTVGGISRLATFIQQRRNALGQENLLLLDGGDYSMGTLFHTIIRETGSELQLMSALKYDAITFGNHEFDYYPDGLAQSIKSAMAAGADLPPIVISNMIFDPQDPADDQLKTLWDQKIIRPYVVINKGNIKIGIFGLMGAKAADVAANAKPISFSDPIETAKRISKILTEKEQVDLVIVLSHGGITKDPSASLGWRGDDVDLLTQVTGIDIVVGGHSHTPLFEPIIKDNRIILQAGSEAQFLGELELTLEANQADINFNKSNYELHKIDDKIIGQKDFTHKINQFKNQVTELFLKKTGYQFDQVIAQSYRRLGRDFDDNVIANMVTDAMRIVTNADIAVTTNGPIRDDIYLGSNGIQQVSDIFRIVPLGVGVTNDEPGYDIVKVWFTGREIKNMIEVLLLGTQMRGRSYFPRFSGFQVTYNTARIPFDQISEIKLGNAVDGYQEIDLSTSNSQLYSMATNSFIGSLAWLIEDFSHGIVEVNPKLENGEQIAGLKSAVFDSNNEKPGVQEIKEWFAFFEHIKTLPDSNNDGIVDLPTESEIRLFKNHSYKPTDLYKNATWIMITSTLIIMLVVFSLFLILRKFYRRILVKN